MSRKNKSALRSIKKQGSSLSALPSSLPSSDIESSAWYRSIATLPLNKFIDITVDGNLFALLISGTPDLLQLKESWETIKSQYAEAIGDHEHVAYVKLFKEINLLHITLKQIHLLIDTLKEIFYQPFADRLNKLLSTTYNFSGHTPAEYLKLLQACHNRSKAFKIDLDLKLIHFKAIEEKNSGEGNPYTREYFLSMLIIVSNHAKFQISDSVTVFEFCKRMKMYADYCEQMEKQYKK